MKRHISENDLGNLGEGSGGGYLRSVTGGWMKYRGKSSLVPRQTTMKVWNKFRMIEHITPSDFTGFEFRNSSPTGQEHYIALLLWFLGPGNVGLKNEI